MRTNTDTDYPIDESWLPNDGLVSVVSAQKPSDDPGVDYDASHIVQGSWNVMPTLPGDHGTVIGLNADSGKTLQFYLDMMQMIESLPNGAIILQAYEADAEGFLKRVKQGAYPSAMG